MTGFFQSAKRTFGVFTQRKTLDNLAPQENIEQRRRVMILSAAEIESIVRLGKPRVSKRSADRLRRMLCALGNCDTVPRGQNPLAQLCAIGVSHGWRELERTTSSLLVRISV